MWLQRDGAPSLGSSCFFQLSSGFSLVLQEVEWGQVGSACEEFKVSEGGVFWINVPESYGAGLPGLSR